MNPLSRTHAIQLPRDQTTVLVVTGLAGFVAPYILAAGADLMPVGRPTDLYDRKHSYGEYSRSHSAAFSDSASLSSHLP
jgi:hypothetical protein